MHKRVVMHVLQTYRTFFKSFFVSIIENYGGLTILSVCLDKRVQYCFISYNA